MHVVLLVINVIFVSDHQKLRYLDEKSSHELKPTKVNHFFYLFLFIHVFFLLK